jgi:hypothetical protein
VSFPGAAPDVWMGLYGGAIVVKGPLFAVTSDGKRHNI